MGWQHKHTITVILVRINAGMDNIEVLSEPLHITIWKQCVYLGIQHPCLAVEPYSTIRKQMPKELRRPGIGIQNIFVS